MISAIVGAGAFAVVYAAGIATVIWWKRFWAWALKGLNQ